MMNFAGRRVAQLGARGNRGAYTCDGSTGDGEEAPRAACFITGLWVVRGGAEDVRREHEPDMGALYFRPEMIDVNLPLILGLTVSNVRTRLEQVVNAPS